MKILIKNGSLWNGETFIRADILTEKDIVAKISDKIEQSVDSMFNAENKIVSPGLIDLHTHMSGVSPVEFGIHADMSCIPFGVTAAADACGTMGDCSVVNSHLTKGCVFAGVGISDNSALFEHTEKMLEKYGNCAVGIKLCFDSSQGSVKDITPVAEVVGYARKHNLIVMVHCSNSPVKMFDIVNVLGKGDILTHAYHGGVNNAAEDNFESIREAKRRGVVVDAGLAGYVHTDFEILRHGIECGAIPDTISTDITRWSAYMRGGRYGMTMCMSIMKTLGMSEKDIFKAVTTTPSTVLGKDKQWGCLKEGRCADIAVFEYADNENRIYDKKGYRCMLTVVNGQIVYRY